MSNAYYSFRHIISSSRKHSLTCPARALPWHPVNNSVSAFSVSPVYFIEVQLIYNIVLTSTVHAHVLSHLSCVWLFATLGTVAHQAPLSMGFSRQEYWVAMPSSRGSSNPGLPHCRQSLYCWATREAQFLLYGTVIQLYIYLSHSFPLWFIPGYWIWFPVV